MLLQEIKDLLGKKTPSLKNIAKKHKVSLRVLQVQLSKGTKIEMEHINDKAVADEIARDHLNELPDYYDRLEQVEK